MSLNLYFHEIAKFHLLTKFSRTLLFVFEIFAKTKKNSRKYLQTFLVQLQHMGHQIQIKCSQYAPSSSPFQGGHQQVSFIPKSHFEKARFCSVGFCVKSAACIELTFPVRGGGGLLFKMGRGLKFALFSVTVSEDFPVNFKKTFPLQQ